MSGIIAPIHSLKLETELHVCVVPFSDKWRPVGAWKRRYQQFVTNLPKCWRSQPADAIPSDMNYFSKGGVYHPRKTGQASAEQRTDNPTRLLESDRQSNNNLERLGGTSRLRVDAWELEQFTKSSVPTDIAALGLLGLFHGAVQYEFDPNGVSHLLCVQRPSPLFLRRFSKGHSDTCNLSMRLSNERFFSSSKPKRTFSL